MRITSALRLIPVFGMRYCCSKDCSERSKLPAGSQLLFPVSQDAAMKLAWIPFISLHPRSFIWTNGPSFRIGKSVFCLEDI
jgi:hypothetical protein